MTLDINIMNNTINDLESKCNCINEVVDKIVNSYSSELDNLMLNINNDIVGIDDCPISIIERYFIELSSAIYFVGSKVETLGIYDGVSKLSFKDKYNDSFILNSVLDEKGKKKTAAEITAISEKESLYESTVNDMYNRAYKIVKSKVDAAETMCSTLSKVLSRRMQNENSASIADNIQTRQILNEGNIY